MLLSLFCSLKYNEVAAASTTKKGMTVMAEFGENLKRVREEKGLTQQTLADNLFVTRQAVSRWEGGSRYPDLMTAKKMAQFLEVSLEWVLPVATYVIIFTSSKNLKQKQLNFEL
jgi:transcriptional regulator with XRE-family HTH domain